MRHMSPKDIRRKGLGEEVRSLLRCRHVDQLYLLFGYLVADLVVLDVDVLGALVVHWIHGKTSLNHYTHAGLGYYPNI